MRWNKSMAALAALAALHGGLAAAPAPAAAQMAEGVAAIVNDEVISTYDVRQRATLLLASSGIQPTSETLQRARLQALRDLVDERLQLQEAAEYEINVSDDQINATLGDIARQNNTTGPQLVQQLASAGINPSTLRQQVRADIAWRRLIGGRYGTRVRVSPLEITETQARIAQSAARAQYLMSEIFLPADSEAEFAEVQAGADRLLQEMQRGAPFPLVARQFSGAPSAAAGGDLGWVTAGELRPDVQTIVDRLAPGQVSTPIRTQEGVYIVALRDRREGRDAATLTRVGLRQVSVPVAARQGLERAGRRINSCESLGETLQGLTGVEVTDLGIATESDLSDSVRGQIANVQEGRAASVVEAGDRAALIVVCSREVVTEGVPSREEIENRLYEQELAMLSQRYLRDLRREATIITR